MPTSKLHSRRRTERVAPGVRVSGSRFPWNWSLRRFLMLTVTHCTFWYGIVGLQRVNLFNGILVGEKQAIHIFIISEHWICKKNYCPAVFKRQSEFWRLIPKQCLLCLLSFLSFALIL